MKYFLLVLFLCTFLPVNGQQKLVLENIRTGRQKEIRPGNRMRISFISFTERASISQTGRLAAVTDSTLTYTTPANAEKVTVAFSNITSLGKYNNAGALLLGIASFGIGGAAWAVLEERYTAESSGPLALLSVTGASLLYNGLETLVYPRRKLNQPEARWRIKVAP